MRRTPRAGACEVQSRSSQGQIKEEKARCTGHVEGQDKSRSEGEKSGEEV